MCKEKKEEVRKRVTKNPDPWIYASWVESENKCA